MCVYIYTYHIYIYIYTFVYAFYLAIFAYPQIAPLVAKPLWSLASYISYRESFPSNGCIPLPWHSPLAVGKGTTLIFPLNLKELSKCYVYVRWTPHPVIVTIMDNRDYIRVLLYSYYTTITGWGVLLMFMIGLRGLQPKTVLDSRRCRPFRLAELYLVYPTPGI